MQQRDFEQIVKQACQADNLPLALDFLQQVEEEDIASAAASLIGQFAIAEIEGEKRIYHLSQQESDEGELQDFVEHIMNEGDDVIEFIAWFFDIMFDVKKKDIYQAAGRTYSQPKRQPNDSM